MPKGLPSVLNGRSADIPVRTLIEKFGDRKRGDLIEYAEIEKAVDIQRGTGRWNTVTQRFVREMREQKSIHLKCEMNSGYRLCTPEQQLTVGVRYGRRAARAIKRGVRIMEVIPDNELPEPLRRERDHAVQINASAYLRLQSDTKALTVRLAAPEAMPKVTRQ